MDQDQARDAAVEADVLEHHDERDQDRLVRDEHPEEQQGEDDVGASEAPLGQHVAVQRAQQHRHQSRRHHQQHAVDEARRQLVEGVEVGLQCGRGRHLPGGGVRHLGE